MSKLEKWAHISEIVGGIAIVVTIAVLIVEVRTNSALLERQIELDRIDRMGDIGESPYLPEILDKIKAVDTAFIGDTPTAFMDRYSLTFVEADRWTRYLRGQWQAWEADFLAGQIGQLEELIPLYLGFPDQALYWYHSSENYDESFVDYVDELAPDFEKALDDR